MDNRTGVVGEEPMREVTAEHRGSASGAASGSRFAGAEVVRVLSACAVIWIHGSTPKLLQVATFAVPCFAALAALLATRSGLKPAPQATRTYIWQRTVRVGVPFFAWSLVYIGLHLVLGVPPVSVRDIVRPGFLLRGGDYHLWFLPFVLVATVLAFRAGKWLGRLEPPRQRTVVGCLVAVAVAEHMPL
jgi:hypothetical protein